MALRDLVGAGAECGPVNPLTGLVRAMDGRSDCVVTDASTGQMSQMSLADQVRAQADDRYADTFFGSQVDRDNRIAGPSRPSGPVWLSPSEVQLPNDQALALNREAHRWSRRVKVVNDAPTVPLMQSRILNLPDRPEYRMAKELIHHVIRSTPEGDRINAEADQHLSRLLTQAPNLTTSVLVEGYIPRLDGASYPVQSLRRLDRLSSLIGQLPPGTTLQSILAQLQPGPIQDPLTKEIMSLLVDEASAEAGLSSMTIRNLQARARPGSVTYMESKINQTLLSLAELPAHQELAQNLLAWYTPVFHFDPTELNRFNEVLKQLRDQTPTGLQKLYARPRAPISDREASQLATQVLTSGLSTTLVRLLDSEVLALQRAPTWDEIRTLAKLPRKQLPHYLSMTIGGLGLNAPPVHPQLAQLLNEPGPRGDLAYQLNPTLRTSPNTHYVLVQQLLATPIEQLPQLRQLWEQSVTIRPESDLTRLASLIRDRDRDRDPGRQTPYMAPPDRPDIQQLVDRHQLQTVRPELSRMLNSLTQRRPSHVEAWAIREGLMPAPRRADPNVVRFRRYHRTGNPSDLDGTQRIYQHLDTPGPRGPGTPTGRSRL